MTLSRRRFVNLSGMLLGHGLLDFLTTPLHRWSTRPFLSTFRDEGPSQQSGSKVQFLDVAREAGLRSPNVWGGMNQKDYIIETKGSGVAFFDYDHDGWLDIYLSNGTRLHETWQPGTQPTTHLYRNNRDGTFTDVTSSSGIGRTGWQTGVCVGDFDNDGWDDLFCTFWGHNILFHNNGNGTFTDVTKQAGLWRDELRWGSGCTWLDYNRDGHLDLFIANYLHLDFDKVPKAGESPICKYKGSLVMCGPRGLPGGTNLLYRNNGNGTFTDVSEASGILKPGPRYSITAVSSDLDNDGWPDIYVAVDSEPSILYRNNHDGTFSDIAVMAGCAYGEDGSEQAGMGVAIGDYDGDGNMDIFKTNFSEDSVNLYHNNGDGTFTDVSSEAGLGGDRPDVKWGCGWVDYDNDGWVDLMQVNGHVYPNADAIAPGQSYLEPRVVYKNLRNGRFADVSHELGPGISARHSSRGCAFGDYDNDGDMDVLIDNINEVPSLLRNDCVNSYHWIKIKLLGTLCNRTAIGARVKITAGEHTQMAEVQSGSSVMSQNDLRLHFGLGAATSVDKIEVIWPTSQRSENFLAVSPDQLLVIKEGHGIIQKQHFPMPSLPAAKTDTGPARN